MNGVIFRSKVPQRTKSVREDTFERRIALGTHYTHSPFHKKIRRACINTPNAPLRGVQKIVHKQRGI